LATAVDDVDDDITHVLRGRDHVPNTEFQTAIIRALGHEPPHYIHAPLLTFGDGGKISKREGAGPEGAGPSTVAALRAEGFLPLAVSNALALSLADFGTEELMTSLGEMAERFSIERLHTADSQFDADKLRWVNGQHIRELSDEELRGELAALGASQLPPAAVEAARTGGATLVECAALARELVEPPEPDAEARELAATPEAAAALARLLEISPGPPASTEQAESVFEALKSAIREDGGKLGPSLRGLRSLLTGRAHGAEFPFVLATLTADRIERARATAGLNT
jgi:glutamyl/glutaminyl-tRNA synthetase